MSKFFLQLHVIKNLFITLLTKLTGLGARAASTLSSCHMPAD